MKELGLPLGFMNTSALHVNEDGTYKLSQDMLPVTSNETSNSTDNSRNYSNKRQHKKRGKKKVMS